jgi:hypothetical protein
MVFSRSKHTVKRPRAGTQTDWDDAIVMIPMISNSPRCATLWATPVSERKEAYGYVPMILCESEPGNINCYKND